MTCPRAADVFRNVGEFRLLLHFMGPEGSTVAALARRHGLSLNAAYRKVQKFGRLGLLTVLREERRAGRAVKVYGCPHQSFFIPRDLIPLEEQVTETFGPYQHLLAQKLIEASRHPANPVGGLIFTVRAGGLWLLPATERGERWRPDVPGTPAHVHSSGPLYLDYQEARALERELYALFDRYRRRRGSAPYLLHMVLAPIPGVGGFALPQSGYTECV
ncbi:MAG: helix-turn-helix domain-containing protein [Deinococcota bacterium]